MSGLTTPGSEQAKIFLVRPWQHEGRKMPTLLPNGWLIFSIFVYVDGSHVFLMVPGCAIDEVGPGPEQGPTLLFLVGPTLGCSSMYTARRG